MKKNGGMKIRTFVKLEEGTELQWKNDAVDKIVEEHGITTRGNFVRVIFNDGSSIVLNLDKVLFMREGTIMQV